MVLDNETGGLDRLLHPITQFAAILYDSKFEEINRFSTFVKPYNNLQITEKALSKTMVTMAQINKGEDVKNFVSMLIQFAKQGRSKGGKRIKKSVIVGHNVTFDIGFLRYAFDLVGEKLEDHFESNNGEIDYLDTMKMAYQRWPKFSSDESDKYNLTACCSRLNIKLHDAHGAMADVIATSKVYKALSSDFSDEGVKTDKKVKKVEESEEEVIKTRKFFQL